MVLGFLYALCMQTFCVYLLCVHSVCMHSVCTLYVCVLCALCTLCMHTLCMSSVCCVTKLYPQPLDLFVCVGGDHLGQYIREKKGVYACMYACVHMCVHLCECLIPVWCYISQFFYSPPNLTYGVF